MDLFDPIRTPSHTTPARTQRRHARTHPAPAWSPCPPGAPRTARRAPASPPASAPWRPRSRSTARAPPRTASLPAGSPASGTCTASQHRRYRRQPQPQWMLMMSRAMPPPPLLLLLLGALLPFAAAPRPRRNCAPLSAAWLADCVFCVALCFEVSFVAARTSLVSSSAVEAGSHASSATHPPRVIKSPSPRRKDCACLLAPCKEWIGPCGWLVDCDVGQAKRGKPKKRRRQARRHHRAPPRDHLRPVTHTARGRLSCPASWLESMHTNRSIPPLAPILCGNAS